MPIVVDHSVNPQVLAEAAALGSGAAVAAEQDWRERQMAEAQFQADRDYDYRVQAAALQDRMSRYEMGNRTALSFAGLQSNNYNNQLDYMLGQQQLAQRDEQLGVQAALAADEQQQLTDRTQISQLGQIARQQQQQRFEVMMSERKAFEDNIHMYTPRQQQQFRERLSEKYGIPYDAPEQAMAEEDAIAQQDRVAKIRQAFSNPFDPEQSLLPPGAEEWALQLTPKELMDVSIKAQGEERQRRQLQQKEGEAEWRLAEEDEKAQQKEVLERQKEATKTMRDSVAGEREYRQAQEEYSRDLEQYNEDLQAHELAKSAHAKMASSAQRTGSPAKPFTQTPPVKPVPPTPGLFADKIPTPLSEQERDALAPGTRYIAPNGEIRVRK